MFKSFLTPLFSPVISVQMFAQEKKESEESEEVVDFSLEELLNVEITTAGKQAEKISDIPGSVSIPKMRGRRLIFNSRLLNKYRGRKWKVRAMLMINENGSVASVRLITKLPADLRTQVIRQCSKWRYISSRKVNRKWYKGRGIKRKGKTRISISFPLTLKSPFKKRLSKRKQVVR